MYYANNTIIERKKIVDYVFDNKTPIYMQLVDKIRLNIVSGKFKKGERLLSVRELALEFKVNPNTMQKALVELEQEGLIYTQRTSGKFVTENEEVIREAKYTLAMDKVKTFMQDMESIGINKSEILLYLQEMEKNFYGTFKN